jgi:uncharacterized membrane protein (DUF2068 family)
MSLLEGVQQIVECYGLWDEQHWTDERPKLPGCLRLSDMFEYVL